jgi:hypothetical protein
MIVVTWYIGPRVHARLTIRIASSAKPLIHSWRQSATWALLCLYLLTGPVIGAVHSEPLCLSSACGSGVAIHPPGDANRHVPVDPSHVCVICTQLTERLTTPALPYHLSPLLLISLLTMPVFHERPVTVQYFSPDKRGPPPARV